MAPAPTARKSSKSSAETLETGLRRLALAHLPGATDVSPPKRLSGGASQETWSFDALTDGAPVPLILRRSPPGKQTTQLLGSAIPLATEARLIELSAAASLPVPSVRHVLTAEDELGEGFVMERLEGETLARRILRDAEFEDARPRLARQCGEILAGIHAVPKTVLPELPTQDARAQLEQYRGIYDHFDDPRPVFELAFRFIEDNLPEASEQTLVHGDFRNGNLMIDREGVRGVLDWELAHVGDPMEDLGWICVNSWRFGGELPVGGFGTREDLAAGYEAAGGGAVDLERVRLWEIVGTLKWGVICTMMLAAFRHGGDRSVERAAIGRRASETEIDLLELIAP